MELGIQISTTILNNRDTEIGVNSFEQSGQDDAAGSNAKQNQRVNVIGAKDHIEIRTGKGADAMLGDDYVTLFRSDDRRNRSERLPK